MDVAVSWNTESRVVCTAFCILRNRHTYFRTLFRTILSRFHAGGGADSYNNMLIADLSRNSSLGKVFRIDGISSGIIVTDTFHSQLAGFPADLSRFDTIRNGKAGIGQPFVNPFHDLSPNIFMEGSSAIATQGLVIITTAPDAGSVVRREAYKPDIVVGSSRTALSSYRHIAQPRSGTG